LQIPYLVFELLDHFSLGLATLTLGRRQWSGNLSAGSVW
jgi:hypothetical protein